MKAENDAPATAKLNFGTAVAVSCCCVFGSWTFVKLSALPFLLSLAILMLQGAAVPRGIAIAILLLDLVPFAVLGVLVSRAVLGEARADVPAQPLIARQMLLYLIYAAVLLAIVFIPVVVAFVGAVFLAYSHGGPGTRPVGWWYNAAWLLPWLLASYTAARLSLVLPAVSLGRKPGLTAAWNLGRNSGLKLLGLFVASYIPVALAGLLTKLAFGYPLLTGPFYSIELWPGLRLFFWNFAGHLGLAVVWTALSFLGFGLATCALASAYDQLNGRVNLVEPAS